MLDCPPSRPPTPPTRPSPEELRRALEGPSARPWLQWFAWNGRLQEWRLAAELELDGAGVTPGGPRILTAAAEEEEEIDQRLVSIQRQAEEWLEEDLLYGSREDEDASEPGILLYSLGS